MRAMPGSWKTLWLREPRRAAMVDPRRRMLFCLAAFAALLLVVFLQAVRLEATQGAAFRAEATRPLRREKAPAGVRGRILSYDGQTLAAETPTLALAVHYRYLQEPPDAAWLRRQLARRLSRGERKDPSKVLLAQDDFLDERGRQTAQLAELGGVALETWQHRARRVQARVERIAASVNRRRDEALAAASQREEPPPAGLREQVARAIRDTLRATMDDPPPPRITVAEELDYHVMVEDLPPAVAARIEAQPERFPGVRILRQSRRHYPAGPLAAHALGHLGMLEEGEAERLNAEIAGLPTTLTPGPSPASGRGELDLAPSRTSGRGEYSVDDFVGRLGSERQYERLLRGRRGATVEWTDHGGRVLSVEQLRKPTPGSDLVLTLDARLQRAAESLLDSAIERQATLEGRIASAGGAIVVLDIESGAVRAAAATPRFDPNRFALRLRDDLGGLMNDPAKPLFDRTSRMAIAPGSTFKTLTALALMQSRAIDPETEFTCQGYLRRPDRQRCEIFVQQKHGHGAVTLYDALAQSCNVYFFHHAGRMGHEPLLEWAARFGIGRPTGIDLPSEAAGTLPTPETIADLEAHEWRVFDTQAVAIGQGSLTATPLQMAVLMAAVGNDGRRVTPHLLSGLMLRDEGDEARPASPRVPEPVPIVDLRPQTLEVVREGLRMVVADEHGTAHGTVDCAEVAIAGKTGTAETGGGRPSHAWFAGYVPADRPRLAFVVVLEHGGSGALAAGPVAKRLVLVMRELGML